MKEGNEIKGNKAQVGEGESGKQMNIMIANKKQGKRKKTKGLKKEERERERGEKE